MSAGNRCGYYFILKSLYVVSAKFRELNASLEKSQQDDTKSVNYGEEIPIDLPEKLKKLKEEVFTLYVRTQKVDPSYQCSMKCDGRHKGGENFYGCPWEKIVQQQLLIVGQVGDFLTYEVIKPLLEDKLAALFKDIDDKSLELLVLEDRFREIIEAQ